MPNNAQQQKKQKAAKPHDYAEHLAKSANMASDGSILWGFNGLYWEPFDEKEGERNAYAWLVKNGGREAASSQAARMCYRAAVLWLHKLPEPDPNQTIIPCQNGYLHLQPNNSLALLPTDRVLGLTHCLRCDYNPAVPRPERFLKFLERVLPDPEVRSRVQEYIGYTFLPDARFQRAQLWIGSGANGKGTLANIIQALHSKTAAVALDRLEGFYLSGLVGASLVYCDEAPQRGIAEQALKSLIAGEAMLVNRKYLEPITIRIRGKWLVLGNHVPSISDQSVGFWRRWDIVPFSVEISESERNPLLEREIVDNELGGVLNWALDGLVRLLARGRFDTILPQAMSEMLNQAKVETNSVAAWVNECDIHTTDTPTAPKARVYAAYYDWCRVNGMSAVASPKFWKRLSGVMPGLASARPRLADGSQPHCCNLSLPSPSTAFP